MVGLGPGNPLDRTRRAEQAILQSSIVAGYTPYVKSIEDLIEGKEVISTGMTREVDRCREALHRARNGKIVSLVSSGDPGVYGMAGLVIELCASENLDVDIEIIPGVPAANTAAARFGAPLMCDFATLSLSDLLVPWETIEKRLEAVAAADLVAAIYNPRSSKRVAHLEKAAVIFRKYRPSTTPVGIATAVSTPDEHIEISDLGSFTEREINMRSIVVVGNNSACRIADWIVVPRGYYL